MKIRIDKETISKNKDAGKTTSKILNRKVVTFKHNAPLPDYFVENENYFISSKSGKAL